MFGLPRKIYIFWIIILFLQIKEEQNNKLIIQILSRRYLGEYRLQYSRYNITAKFQARMVQSLQDSIHQAG